MSVNASIKEEVKKQLRAILLSSPVGLTLGELKRDYETFIGSPLPYRKFGYSSAEDFVKDIPETITVSCENGIIVLKTPSDSTTAHIERLVSRQNIPKRNKYAVLRKRFGPSDSRNWREKCQPNVPLFIRNHIKELCASYPDGLPLTHFDPAFSRQFGMHLDDKRLGFLSMQDLLNSIPDIVKLVKCGREWRVLPAFSADEIKMTREHKGNSSSSQQKNLENSYCEKQRHFSSEISDSCPQSPNSSAGDDIDEEVQNNISNILKSKPEGMWSNQLPTEYKRFVGKELQFMEYGFLSIIEFVSALPNIVKIERPVPNGDWFLTHIDLPKHAESSKPKAVQNKTLKSSGSQVSVKPQLRESIRQVLQAHPDGVLMSDFPDIFLTMTGMKLEDMAEQFTTLETFFLSLTSDILQMQYKGGCLMLYAVESNESRSFNYLLEKYRPHLTPEVTSVSAIPEDSVGPGVMYTAVDLPSLTDYIEVYVANINSPSDFWIQLRGAETTLALERLMDLLERYKFADGEKYLMPESLIAKGQVCAVVFPEDNNWHRGIITGIRNPDFVDVFYVDYGNTCSVHKNTVRLLRSRYFRLPAQAVSARLANIRPIDSTWPQKAKQRMLDICRCKPLIALVTGIKDRVLSICLTDTTSDVDVHVNDVLVHEKYAVFLPDQQQTCNSNEVPAFDTSNSDNAITEGHTNQSASSLQVTNQEVNKRFVRACQMTPSVTLHVVNWQSELFVLSAEISALFWEVDILRSMLQRKKINPRKLTIGRDDCPQLFTELTSYGVKAAENKDFITLYCLEALPSILSVFNHPSSELKELVQAALHSLNPKDPYWKGIDSESDSCSELGNQLEDLLLGLDELRLTLQALQFKRKRIIENLMRGNVSHVDSVNQINEVEMQITKTKELIDELETMEKDLPTGIQFKPDTNTFPEKGKTSAAPTTTTISPSTSTRLPIKTNVVAPMIVHPVSQTKSSHTNPCTGSVPSANQDMTSILKQQQIYQSLPSQGTAVWDPSMMGMLSGFSVMIPIMRSPTMTAMPSLGRGQPMPGFHNSPRFLPDLQNMPDIQNLLNINPQMAGTNSNSVQRLDGTGENPMLLPGLLPLLRNLQLGSGRGGSELGHGGK